MVSLAPMPTTAMPTSPKANGAANGNMAPAVAGNAGKTGVATVFQVKSGDTVVLMSPSTGKGRPATMDVSIAGLQAPRLGVKTPAHTTPDEAHAWESREFLRAKLLNKQVQFKVHYDRNNRSYAEVRADGVNIALEMLGSGMAKLLSTQETKKLPGFNEYEEAAAKADTEKVGVYASGNQPREIQNAMDATFSLEKYVEQNKGARRKAIVEYVRDGGCLRLCIVPEGNDNTYVYIPIMVSGVNTPRMKRGGGENVTEYEPFYQECHFWVESRFLSREVEVRIESMRASQNPSQPFNVYGSIYHPKGNLSEFLLQEGFATYLDYTAKLSEAGPQTLRAAQAKAQEQKKRRWAHFDGSGDSAGKEFNARVIEICSGDQIRVLNLDDNEAELRLYLSSVKAPAGQSRARPQAEEYYRESMEFLRTNLIGKVVKCQPDYVKHVTDLMKKDEQGKPQPGQVGPPQSDGKGNLIFVTVLDAGENIALKAVKEGLLNVTSHRDTDERSRAYDALLTAEEEAKAAGIGRHSEKPSLKPNVLELTGAQDPSKRKEMSRRAESMFDDIKKKERTGIVQYCITGSRFRCNVQTDIGAALLAFKIDGINAPNVAPPNADPKLPNSKSEPFGPESLRECKLNIMQQDVTLRFDGVDRAGVFRGRCTFKKDKKKCDLGKELLSKGLAFTDGWCEDKDYLEAERIAKQNKLGWWSIAHAEEQAAGAQDKTGQTLKGELGQLNSISSFYIVDSKGENSAKINTELLKAQPDSLETADDPKRGAMYCAKYSEDRKWYRAKCSGPANRAQKTYKMLFVDYGMDMEVNLCDIKKMPAGHPLQSLPPAAVHCSLYGVKGSDDYWNEACEALFNAAGAGAVTAAVEGFKEGVAGVVLKCGSKCANLEVVGAGAARLLKKQKPTTVENYSAWEEAQAKARQARSAMWQYGDDYDSDEE